MKTKDIYEATWYVINGAKIIDVRTQKLYGNQLKKKRYPEEWTIYLENVPKDAIEKWRGGVAQYPLQRFASYRRRVKKAIFKIIDKKKIWC